MRERVDLAQSYFQKIDDIINQTIAQNNRDVYHGIESFIKKRNNRNMFSLNQGMAGL